MGGPQGINPGMEISEGLISSQTKVIDGVGTEHQAKSNTDGIQLFAADYSGAMYQKTVTASDDNAFRLETTALKLRDCLIECETQDALTGDATAQPSTILAGTGRGYGSIDISTVYFKNKAAGQNCKIIITGVRE